MTPSKNSTNTGKRRVRFSTLAPSANRVELTADFTNWQFESLKPQANGTWAITRMLPPGRYEYRLVVDGEWTSDPTAQERVTNPFGSQNDVRVIV